MLVIISDLHLTDGTSTASLSAEAFQTLEQRLQEMAVAASWRADGKYRPLERVDLVLLGDTLDLMRTECWQQASIRPWSDSQSVHLAQTVERIVDGVLRENEAGLERLRGLAHEGGIGLPPATQSGHPVASGERLPVHVRIHYMVGDQDWLLHLPGAAYDAIRKRVSRQLGLATPYDQPFPHEPAESSELLQALRRHRLLARHGDQFCLLSCGEQRDQSSVADVLAIELIGPYLREVKQQLEESLPASVLAGLAELDHVRPLPLVASWLDSYVQRSPLPAATRARMKRIWDDLVEDLLPLEPIRRLGEEHGEVAIDGLAGALAFRRRAATGWSQRTLQWLNQLRGTTTESYACHALAEQDFRNRRARHVVYGHTHQAEIVGLDASCADGFVLNQLYFNAGTWRRTYQPTLWAGASREYIATQQLHLLAFYQGDERGGRTFEMASSVLAAQPISLPHHRLDTAASAVAVPHHVPFSGPHFRQPQHGGISSQVG